MVCRNTLTKLQSGRDISLSAGPVKSKTTRRILLQNKDSTPESANI